MENKGLGHEIDLLREQIHQDGSDAEGLVVYADMLARCLEEVLSVIEKQGHSGMSVSLLTHYVYLASKGLPFTPLTGKEDEWNDWYHEVTYPRMPGKMSQGYRQNKRYSSLIQYSDGTLEDWNRIVCVDNESGKTYYTFIPPEAKAKVPPIKFPYSPVPGEYKLYVSTYYFDDSGKDVTENHPGEFNRKFYRYLVDSKGNRINLDIWYIENEKGELEKAPVKKEADMNLQDTASLMTSADYKTRFMAECLQLQIRLKKLRIFIAAIEQAEEDGTEAPKHDCPLELLKEQESAMEKYLDTLQERAIIENIPLPLEGI